MEVLNRHIREARREFREASEIGNIYITAAAGGGIDALVKLKDDVAAILTEGPAVSMKSSQPGT
jgi:hypothetical protein